MYRPRHYDIDDPSVLARFMREHAFVLLVTAADGVPVASHIPLILDSDPGQGDGGQRFLGHVAKANRQWQAFDGKTEAMAMFWGPHAYISPSWYESQIMVPTWNYVTVHAYGKPKILSDPAAARDVLERLTSEYESQATGNWSMDRLPESYIEKMLDAIVAFEMPIDRVEGKFKLNQKNSPADREGAIKGLRATDDPESLEVARLMAEILADG